MCARLSYSVRARVRVLDAVRVVKRAYGGNSRLYTLRCPLEKICRKITIYTLSSPRDNRVHSPGMQPQHVWGAGTCVYTCN